MYNPSKRHNSGFSLMEMLVVVSIIVILAGLTFGGFNYVTKKQAREQAKIQIGLLQLALEDFKAENGFYPANPSVSGENGTPEIFEALFPPNPEDKTYLSALNPESDQQGWLQGEIGQRLTIFDPWGQEYRYRTNDPSDPNSTISANPGFDLWSIGPDGRTAAGGNGDYDANAAANLDDIRGW